MGKNVQWCHRGRQRRVWDCRLVVALSGSRYYFHWAYAAVYYFIYDNSWYVSVIIEQRYMALCLCNYVFDSARSVVVRLDMYRLRKNRLQQERTPQQMITSSRPVQSLHIF